MSKFSDYSDDEIPQQSLFETRICQPLEFRKFEPLKDKQDSFDITQAKIQGELTIFNQEKQRGANNKKSTYFLINQNLCEVEDFNIVKKLNIEFCQFSTLTIDSPQQGSQKCDSLYAFKLKRNHRNLIFVTENETELAKWELALEAYVIKERISRYYECKDPLGAGSYSKVFLGKSLIKQESTFKEGKSIEKVAIKRLDKQKVLDAPDGIDSLINEIRVHWALQQCENILKLFQIFESRHYIYLVLELQTGGSLLSYIIKQKEFSENQIKNIMEQLFLALDFIHQKQIIHRDIKLDNILVNHVEGDSFDVRIADFGLAVFTTHDQQVYVKCGTPGYVAPEMIRDQGYTYQADIFSLGSLLFNLFTGRYLFAGKDKNEILKNNAKCDISSIGSYLQRVSGDAINLLFKLLESNPSKRPTSREALEHTWFKNDQQIIHDLLNVNDTLCQHEKIQPGSPHSHNIYENNGSYSSFRVGSNYFQNFQNILSSKQNDSLNIPRGRLNSNVSKNNVSSHSSGDNHEGSNSPRAVSYYNAIKFYRERSKGKSFLEKHYHGEQNQSAIPKSNSTPMKLQFASEKKEPPAKRKYSQFKNQAVIEFNEDKMEESKRSSSFKEEIQKPNDVQEVDDIQLSGNSDNDNDKDNEIIESFSSGEDLSGNHRLKIDNDYDVKMPSSMLMSKKNEHQIGRIFM